MAKKKFKPEKTEEGSYRVRWYQNKKRRCKTFKTKALATSFCKDLNKDIFPEVLQKDGSSVKRRGEIKTFLDLAEKYMQNHVTVNCSASTIRNCEMYLRIHILPFFASLELVDLHLTDLDDFMATLSKKERQKGERDRSAVLIDRKTRGKRKILSEKMQRELVSLVLSIISYGCGRDYLKNNPFQGFKLKRLNQKKMGYFNGAEVEKFLSWCERGGPYIPDPKIKDDFGQPVVEFTPNIERDTQIFKIALHTGAREGEILGLKRKAIDFSNRLIWFSEIYDFSAKEFAERTKGKNVRCIEFDETVAEILNKYKDLDSESLIFDIKTRPLWMDAFYLYCNRAGVKVVSFHALRHTFASAMALYTPAPVLKNMLGHKSLATTMKYVHVAQSDSAGYTKNLKSMYQSERDPSMELPLKIVKAV